jgi:hypothetical protein
MKPMAQSHPSTEPQANGQTPTKTTRPLRWVKFGNLPPNTADNVLYALEAALQRLNLKHAISPRNPTTRYINKVLARLHLVRKIAPLSRTAYFIPFGQAAQYRFCPLTYFHEIIPWVFDSWPNLRPKIAAMLRRNKVKVALFTARQSAEYFREHLGIDAFWLPEACNPALYRPDKPLQDRSTDVLELGRKYDRFHDQITPRLEALKKTHLYEKIKGQLIFSGAEALTNGFAEAKISICFPSSITHPERSGNCETVTLRYFESMASRCLIVGHAPAELIDIFGYNPVIEADLDNAAAQIENLLANMGSYQEMVDRNYQAVLQNGVWDVRVKQLLAELEKRGYRAEAAHDTHQQA